MIRQPGRYPVTYATMRWTDGKQVIAAVYRALLIIPRRDEGPHVTFPTGAIAAVTLPDGATNIDCGRATYHALAHQYETPGYPAFEWGYE